MSPGSEPTDTPPDVPEAPTELEKIEKRALHEVVHVWIPLAIVLVSVCAAIVGWRASLADESATHYEELSRQDLIQQQQLLIQDNSSVDSDIDLYGQFAQASSLSQSMLHDAGVLGGALGDQLRIQSDAYQTIALSLGREIQDNGYTYDPSNPTANYGLNSNGTLKQGQTYDAASALAYIKSIDEPLHGLEPESLLSKAESQHSRGVDFTGIAALFIGVLVLLTLGAVVRGRQKLYFAGSGAALGTAAVALFLITQFS